MDTGKRADDDSNATEVTGLKSSMLTRGTFSQVDVTNDDPGDIVRLVVASNFRDLTPLTSNLVQNLVGLI